MLISEEIIRRAVLLASFPKAGNTWVRFLIANVYNELSKCVDEVDFHNIHELIPELDRDKGTGLFFRSFPIVYKTHAILDKSCIKVILVVRNPYDTLYSYYKYLNSEGKVSITLSQLVHSGDCGIQSLVNHTNSYMSNFTNMVIITYENLHKDTGAELRKICQFLNISVDDKVVENSVHKSSFSMMRNIELKKGRKYAASDFLFTRNGLSGEGVKEISRDQELKDYIAKEIEMSPLLKRLYL